MPAAVLKVQGVFVDGSTPVNTVKVTQTLHVPLGTDADVRVAVVNSAGVAVDLTEASAQLAVKQYASDPAPLFTVAGVIGAPASGVVDFAVSEANTNGIGAGQFLFDVVVTFGDAKKTQVVPASCFVVDPAF